MSYISIPAALLVLFGLVAFIKHDRRSLISLNFPNAPSVNRIAGILILIALFVVFNPELRILLMFVDFMGIDVLLVFLTFQFQDQLALAYRMVLLPALRYLCNWSPMPCLMPTPSIMKQQPALAVAAVMYPTATAMRWAAMLIGGCCVIKQVLGIAGA